MKKLFRLLSLLNLLKEQRGQRGYGHHRSRSHYPLYHRPSFRRSLADRMLSRVLGRRGY